VKYDEFMPLSFHHQLGRVSRAIACGSEIEARLLKVHNINSKKWMLDFGNFQSQSFSLSYQRGGVNRIIKFLKHVFFVIFMARFRKGLKKVKKN
jgi:hypothetical protein